MDFSDCTFYKYRVLTQIVSNNELISQLYKGEGVPPQWQRYHYDEARITFPDLSIDKHIRDFRAINIYTFQYRKIFYSWVHVDLLSDVKLSSERFKDYFRVWERYARAVLHIGDKLHPMICFHSGPSSQNLPHGFGGMTSIMCKYCLDDDFDYTNDMRSFSSS